MSLTSQKRQGRGGSIEQACGEQALTREHQCLRQAVTNFNQSRVQRAATGIAARASPSAKTRECEVQHIAECIKGQARTTSKDKDERAWRHRVVRRHPAIES